jgi:hypothetical protein
MVTKVKLVIDSIVDDRIRVLFTTLDKKKKTLDVDYKLLRKILVYKRRIVEGNSFEVIFRDSSDYDSLPHEGVVAKFEPQGQIEVKSTRRSDEAKIRKLLERLGRKGV